MASFDYHQGKVFLRDTFVPFKDANVSIASSPVLYGLSVYTVFSVNLNEATGKCYAFRLRDHYARLLNSARIMDMNTFAAAWPYERFEKTMLELVRKNNVHENVLVRATIFADALIAGTKIHDLPHVLAAYVYPMGEFLPRSGIHMCVSSWTRNADNAIPSRAKVNGGYVNGCLMKNEAILNGYDDAIALDAQGHVTESTAANVFIVRNGTLIAPAVSSDVLEGITRDSILRIARDADIPVVERVVDRSELYIADEAFICGSSARITPILSVDKRPIAAGVIGPITTSLLQKYQEIQNGTGAEAYREWLMDVSSPSS
jgi:branched-chain amino acid aminotransferase